MKRLKQTTKEGTGLKAAGLWGSGKQIVAQCTTYKITIHFVQGRLEVVTNISRDGWFLFFGGALR